MAGAHSNPSGRAQDRLPWEPSKAAEPILRPPSGPLEIFERFDIGPSQIEGFISGQPLSPSEEDVLIKIIYRFPRLGLDNLQRHQKAADHKHPGVKFPRSVTFHDLVFPLIGIIHQRQQPIGFGIRE